MPPNLPGLIHSINPSIPAGGAVYLFDIAYILGVSFYSRWQLHRSLTYSNKFTLASSVYYVLSTLFPAQETMLDRAIIEDETPADHEGSVSVDDDKQTDPADISKTGVSTIHEV